MLVLWTEKKNAQPESWELCFILWTSLGLQAQDIASQITLEGLLPRGKGGARIYTGFCNKDQVVRTSKDDCWLKKARHLKLRNLVPFCVWEDARVWAQWNHSFELHLSSLGPVSCAFSSWVSSGAPLRGLQWLRAWWPASCLHPEFPQSSPSRLL